MSFKVLLVHEYYRSSAPSGEDKVFDHERRLLKSKGIEIETVYFKNDLIGGENGFSVVKAALYTPWSPFGIKTIKNSIHSFQPQIVHFHNTFPLISPSAIWKAKSLGVAIVQTLHNFRHICAGALLLREGSTCTLCVDRFPIHSLRFRCYRNSFVATLPLFFCIVLHRMINTWKSKVDAFIVLSEFNKKLFIKAGFPEEKIYIKPNFFYDADSYCSIKEPYWVFIGRLKEEKGVQFLPSVWQKLGQHAPRLHILGDGPLRNWLKQQIRKLGLQSKITLHGHVNSEIVNTFLQKASCLVFPSLCYEGFPLVIGEAFRAGVPVAVSNIGTPKDIVKDGFTGIHFKPGNVDDMVRKLRELAINSDRLRDMSRNARQEYEQQYTPSKNFSMLMKIYKDVLEKSSGKTRI